MTAPYVKRLYEQIDSSADASSRAVLTSELACYWARVGEFEEAERLRQELRSVFGDGRDIRVSILIMCIEGLLLYFKELSPGAFDRLARARLLSVASKDRELIALTSAWLAHLHFNTNKYVEMADAIRVCIDSLDSSNLPATCRVAMLLGDAHLYSGSASVAQAWYDFARTAALKLGDQAFVGALTYNRSALRIFQARMESAVSENTEDHIRLLAGEVQSAINYQAIARLRSLDHLLATSRVWVLMLQKNYVVARQEINALLAATEVKPLSSQAIILKADLAQCLAALGKWAECSTQIDEVLSHDVKKHDPGDQILIYSSLIAASRLCEQVQDLPALGAALIEAITSHKLQSSAIEEMLLPYTSPLILGL